MGLLGREKGSGRDDRGARSDQMHAEKAGHARREVKFPASWQHIDE